MLVFFLLIIFIWLFSPRPTDAAFYISSVSATVINSPDEELIIYASGSGLTTSPQFLQAAFTKKGETARYFGQTQNLSGEWYTYKSSPTLEDLQNYFFRFDFKGSSWSGELKAKIDTTHEGFKGAGIYILKLSKHITGSGTFSNNFQEIVINVDSVSSKEKFDILENKQEDKLPPKPSIFWNLPSSGKLGDIFKITYSLSNFPAGTEYYVKVRGAQTINDGDYLAENEAWANFPLIKIDDDGNYTGEVLALVSDDKEAKDYVCRLRLRKKGSDSFIESDSKVISLYKPTMSSLKNSSDVSSVVPQRKQLSSPPGIYKEVLGEKKASVSLIASFSGNNEQAKLTTDRTSFIWPAILVGSGMGLIAFSLFPVIRDYFYRKKALQSE